MKDSAYSQQKPDMKLDARLAKADPLKSKTLPDEEKVWSLVERKLQGSEVVWALRPKRSLSLKGKLKPYPWLIGLSGALAIVLTLGLTGALTEDLRATNTPQAPVTGSSEARIPVQTATSMSTAYAAAASIAGADKSEDNPILPIVVGSQDHAMSNYERWQSALGGLRIFADPALMSHDIAFQPSTSLQRVLSGNRTLYQVAPTMSAREIAVALKQVFTTSSPFKISPNLDVHGNTTITSGKVDSATGSVHKGFAVLAGPNQARWSYGDSSALAWRPCTKVDKQGKPGISIIERSTESGKHNCRVLPNDLGPSPSDAIKQAKKLFLSLGYRSSTNLSSVADGQLWIPTGKGWLSNNHQDVFSVFGYLVVSGKPTTLAQTVTFSRSSTKIVSASGFQGLATAKARVKTITPSLGVKRIAEYDLGLWSARHLNLSTGSNYYYMNLSESILNAPAKNYSSPQNAPKVNSSHTKIILVSGYRSFPAVVEDQKGVTWIVPGYAYQDHQGYLGSVIALPARDYKSDSLNH